MPRRFAAEHHEYPRVPRTGYPIVGYHRPPREGVIPMTKVTPFLMFDDQLEAAMEFYTATFPDSQIRNVARTGKDGPVAAAEFVVGGQVFMGYNGARTSPSPKASRSMSTARTKRKSTSIGTSSSRPAPRLPNAAGSRIRSGSRGRSSHGDSWS